MNDGQIMFDAPAVVADTHPLVMVRASDGATSHRAAQAAAPRTGSQKHRLLIAYKVAAAHGLTDEEAAEITGLAGLRSCCWWKRCSELRQAGLIADSSRTRQSLAGEQRMVCVITAAGRDVLSAAREQQAA